MASPIYLIKQVGLHHVPVLLEATLVYPDGSEEVLEAGETAKALQYEIQDIERAIAAKDHSLAFMDYTMKVVELMDRLLTAEGRQQADIRQNT